MFNTKRVVAEEAKRNPRFILLHQFIDRSSGRKAKPYYINTEYISFALRGSVDAGCMMADGSYVDMIPEEFDEIAKKLGNRGVKGICERYDNYRNTFKLEAILNIDYLLWWNVDTEEFKLFGQSEEYEFKFDIEEVKQALES